MFGSSIDMVPQDQASYLEGKLHVVTLALADGAGLWPKGLRAAEKGVRAEKERNIRIP